MSNEANKNNSSTRHLKVYRGHFPLKYRHGYKPHPVIRLSGVYLSALDFQIGDEIEVSTEPGIIMITKVPAKSV